MILADELGYIAWDALGVDDCLYLIEAATARLRELENEKESD